MMSPARPAGMPTLAAVPPPHAVTGLATSDASAITEAPDVLHGIVEGDRLSRERRHGHGNALAQVYNHIIMPLASAHDKTTQVLWGIADFRSSIYRHAARSQCKRRTAGWS